MSCCNATTSHQRVTLEFWTWNKSTPLLLVLVAPSSSSSSSTSPSLHHNSLFPLLQHYIVVMLSYTILHQNVIPCHHYVISSCRGRWSPKYAFLISQHSIEVSSSAVFGSAAFAPLVASTLAALPEVGNMNKPPPLSTHHFCFNHRPKIHAKTKT